MHTALVALTVLMVAAGKPPPPATTGSSPSKGGTSSGSTTPQPLTAPGTAAASPGGASGPSTSAGPPAGTTPRPAGASSVTYVEMLYQKQQYEAADAVLGMALNNPETSTGDKVQLHVLEGMLRMEAFQEPQARKAFQEALNMDREAKLPEFAPPATRALFLDVKATLPVSTTPVKPVESTNPVKRTPRAVPGPYDAFLPWIPVAVGGATLLTGGGFVIASRVIDTSLTTGTAQLTTQEGLRQAVANGKLAQTAGYTMVGVGGAILVGGLIWKFGPDVAPVFTLNVTPSDHGFAAVVSGSLP